MRRPNDRSGKNGRMGERMKVGIVTPIDYANYGNRLQNYAVHHILEDRFGCRVTTLAPELRKNGRSNPMMLVLKAWMAGLISR